MLLILDDEINLSISRLNAKTLPGVEWKLSFTISELFTMRISLDEFIVQHGKMLSVDPEAGCESTINKTENVIYFAGRARFTEVISIFEEVEMFFFIKLREILPFIRIITAVITMIINVFQVMVFVPIWYCLIKDFSSFISFNSSQLSLDNLLLNTI